MLFTFTGGDFAVIGRGSMSDTAHNSYWDRSDWQRRPHLLESPWHPGWIALSVLGFLVWWPVGLALLFFTLGSRKMGCFGRSNRWQDKMDRMRNRMEEHGFGMSRGFYAFSSGNRAFDEYRQDTLRRLEEEQTEFKSFLDRLRHAKDKTEFDQFMAERRSRPTPTTEQPRS
jgi:hypothetical protein